MPPTGGYRRGSYCLTTATFKEFPRQDNSVGIESGAVYIATAAENDPCGRRGTQLQAVLLGPGSTSRYIWSPVKLGI